MSRSFAEKSSYHKMQMLGKGAACRLPLRKPPMKDGFLSKAEADRLSAKRAEATPARPAKNFFHAPHHDASAQLPNARVTNTLTYSDTLFNQTSSELPGRKTDVSEMGTVFGLGGTQRHTHTHNRDIELEEMRKSAHFGPARDSAADPGQLAASSDSPDRTNFMNSRNERHEAADPGPQLQESVHSEGLQNSSQVLEQVQLRREAALRSQKMPAYQASWFHFFTNHVYCCVTSLRLELDGGVFKVPFAIAKLVLTSRLRFERFISSTKFESDGIFEVDFQFLEQIKGERVDCLSYFAEDSHVEVEGRRVGLR